MKPDARRALWAWILVAAVILAVAIVGARSAKAAPIARAIEPGQVIKIMPLGDSITAGIGDPVVGGYRCRLKAYLAAQGQPTDFVGSLSGGSCADNQHEGHSGWTIQDITNIAFDRVTTYQPDVVVLMAGTNDLKLNLDTDHLADRIGVLIDTIKSAKPDVVVVVSTLPAYPAASQAAWRLARGAIPTAAFDHGAYVAYGHNVGPALLADGIHPNCAGYVKFDFYLDYALTWAVPSPNGHTWAPVWPADDCAAKRK